MVTLHGFTPQQVAQATAIRAKVLATLPQQIKRAEAMLRAMGQGEKIPAIREQLKDLIPNLERQESAAWWIKNADHLLKLSLSKLTH